MAPPPGRIRGATHAALPAPLPVSHRPRQLGALRSVLLWELRRISASRTTWLIAAGAFALCCLTVWGNTVVGGTYIVSSPHGAVTFVVPYTSVWGLATTLPESPGILLGVFMPFVCTDAVARDWGRRTRDLILSAPLPSWAYVWGRCLAGLLLSLVFAGLYLVAILLVAVLLHLAQFNRYPLPAFPGDIAVWALIMVPPAVLLSSVSSALGSVVPHHTNLIKAGVLVVWLAGGESLEVVLLRPGTPSWLALWDPTSIAPEIQLNAQLFHILSTAAQRMGVPAFLRFVRVYQQTLPDLHAWVAPHLIWVGVGLLAMAAAVKRFDRIRRR